MSEAETKKNNSGVSIPVIPIVIAVIAGGLFGHFTPQLALKTRILGEIFLSLLFVLVVPLIMVSMICGVTSLGNIRHLEKLGLKTLVYFLSTTLFATVLGLFLVSLFKPGINAQATQNDFPDINYIIVHTPLSGGSILELSEEITYLPSAITSQKNRIFLLDQKLTGIVDSYGTVTPGRIPIIRWLDESGMKVEPAVSGRGVGIRAEERKIDVAGIVRSYIPRNVFQAMLEENVFSLIIISIVFGTVLTTVGEKGALLIAVIEATNATLIKCVVLLMNIAPVGIFGLIAASIGEAEMTNPDGFIAEIVRLARYTGTVIFGICFHGAIVLVLILKFIARRKPVPFIRNMIPQLLTAFSTGSSMATLPVSLTLITGKNKVSEKVANFVLPLGATINMDGTALYQVVAAVFIAQSYGISLGVTAKIILILTATIGSIGAAGIPQAGLVTLVMVLKSVGLPVEGIGMILSVDWFVDRFRTVVNSWGDVVGAAIIDRFE